MSVTSLVFSSLLSLPTTVPLTTNSHVLNVVRHDRNINNSHADHYHHSTSDPSWRKFQPKWDILMSATSLVFLSLFPLPSTLLSTTNSHVESINVFHVNQYQQTISRPGWRKFRLMWYILMSATSLVFFPQVLPAVHGVANLLLTCT